jgi:protoporphyrinogen oxidase
VQVVIGAGPAGLAVAWELRRRGHEVLVLEASDRIGGMAASIDVAGVRVDLGSHRLHPSMPGWLRTELDQLVDLQERRRNGRLLVGDRWVPFPPSGPTAALRLPARVAARAAVDALMAPLRRDGGDTYADVARARVSPALWRSVHEPLAWKVFGIDPRDLAGDLARRRVTATTGGLARSLVPGRRPTFLYPRGGFGALVEALAADVTVQTGQRVTRLIEQDDRVVVGLSAGRIVSADHVHATIPAWQVTALLGTHTDPAPPRPRALALVYLVLDRRPYTPFDAHYLPARHLLPSRVSEPLAYRDDPADPTDRTVLCVEVPCWPGDDVWSAPDDALARRVTDDLVRAGLPDPRPVGVHVERLPSVYPVVTPASLGALSRAERALTLSRRVTVLGRQGLQTPDNTHHVLQMGIAAARCVGDDGTFDHAVWAEARASFRDFTVPD